MCDFTERAVDRVAALGAAGRISPLGVDVFRWAYAQDANAAARVLDGLVALLSDKFPLSVSELQGVCIQGMTEFVHWACGTCGGRGQERLANGVVIVCERCGGSGYRRYTNAARIRGAGFLRGVSYVRMVHRPVEAVLEALRGVDAAVNGSLNEELERRQRTP
jgi:hypothetical protein